MFSRSVILVVQFGRIWQGPQGRSLCVTICPPSPPASIDGTFNIMHNIYQVLPCRGESNVDIGKAKIISPESYEIFWSSCEKGSLQSPPLPLWPESHFSPENVSWGPHVTEVPCLQPWELVLHNDKWMRIQEFDKNAEAAGLSFRKTCVLWYQNSNRQRECTQAGHVSKSWSKYIYLRIELRVAFIVLPVK